MQFLVVEAAVGSEVVVLNRHCKIINYYIVNFTYFNTCISHSWSGSAYLNVKGSCRTVYCFFIVVIQSSIRVKNVQVLCPCSAGCQVLFYFCVSRNLHVLLLNGSEHSDNPGLMLFIQTF